jgi:hypothetical protein
MTPRRLQRSRKKGARTRTGAVYVGRPSKWGNPFVVGPRLPAVEAVARYRSALLDGKLTFTVDDVRRELAGKDLTCWCKPGAPCHADLLLRIANGKTPRR